MHVMQPDRPRRFGKNLRAMGLVAAAQALVQRSEGHMACAINRVPRMHRPRRQAQGPPLACRNHTQVRALHRSGRHATVAALAQTVQTGAITGRA